MRKVTILAIIPIIGFALVFGLSSIVSGGESDRGPSQLVSEYVEKVNDGRFAEAYELTGDSFQVTIPVNTFVKFHEILGYGNRLKYEVGSSKLVAENESDVEIRIHACGPSSAKLSPLTGIFKVTKDGEKWRINLDWKQFYAVKVDLLPPLAQFNRDGVVITLRYVILYPSEGNPPGFTHIRLDIENESGRPVRWDLPIPATGEAYLADSVKGSVFQVSGEYGILVADSEQDFHFIPNSGIPGGTMIFGLGAKASLFIDINELIPLTTQEFDLFLSGLAFSDTNQQWDMMMKDVPFRPEIAPSQ